MSPKCYIIAEAGVNHNGDLKLAHQLIDVAAAAGADAVKFQTFKAEALVTSALEKAPYQARNEHTEQETQFTMLKRLELSREAHFTLKAYCHTKGIAFLSTAFDHESAVFLLQDIQVDRIKVASGELTNAPLLLQFAQAQKPMILSTGMSTLAEIEEALGVVAFGLTQPDATPSIAAFKAAYASPEGKRALAQNVTLLQCTTEYPTAYPDIHLRVMDRYREMFGLPVGFSDHSPGIVAPIAAVARGATLIEKHFTLDKTLPGPDHIASLDPAELHAMVASIRIAEQCLGSDEKHVTAAEAPNRRIARKHLVALRPIAAGEVFTLENLGCKRVSTGLSPIHYWEYLGKTADKAYHTDEAIG